MKQILVSGCSFTEYAEWPRVLFPDCEIHNTGRIGAGNEYIARSVIDTVTHSTVDYVTILWSGLRRVDLSLSKKLEKTELDQWLYKGTTKHSVILFSGGDWTQKTNIDNLWPHPGLDAFYKMKYQGKDQNFLIEQSLLWVMLCQMFLEQNNIKYKFSFIYNPFDPPLDEPSLGPKIKKNHPYLASINWKNYIDITPLEYAIRCNGLDQDGFHPTQKTMNNWAQSIQHFFKE